MPETWDHVRQVIDLLEALDAAPVTLLVVPGSGWDAAGVDALGELQARGYVLAGHGWRHQCGPKTTLYHRIHGAVLSRNVAEHLSRPAAGIVEMMSACHAWFAEHGLEPPTLYVPPAWAMGPVPRSELDALPFRYYETLTGVYDSEIGRFIPLPLTGYEADTHFRAWVLRGVNGLNRMLAQATGWPLRISIHPFDLTYHLAEDLHRLLQGPQRYLGYGELPGAR